MCGWKEADWASPDYEIIGILDGIDERTSSNLQARFSYTCNDIIWDAQFVDMVFVNPSTNKYVVDHTKLSHVEPVLPEMRVSLERSASTVGRYSDYSRASSDRGRSMESTRMTVTPQVDGKSVADQKEVKN